MHNSKGDPTFGWTADLLDNKVAAGIRQGLSYSTASASVSNGMAIAVAVTPTDIAAAKTRIGVSNPDFDLFGR